MHLTTANPDERDSLALLRAEYWRGPLKAEQYQERNRRLYKHTFGKTIVTYLWRDGSGNILSSMDLLSVPILLKKDGRVEEQKAFLVASFVTPKELQGKGHGKTLLKKVIENHPQKQGLLFSAIEPGIYLKANYQLFHARAIRQVVQPSLASYTEVPVLNSLSILRGARRAAVEAGPEGSIAVYPDETLLDWHFERYRYFAEISGRTLPEPVGYQIGKEVLFAVPDYVTDSLDALWMPNKGSSIAGLRAIAAKLQLKNIHFWFDRDIDGVLHDERPMIRLSFKAKANYIDPQMIDYW